jgi:putative ABC transport system substrate-binding protein
MMRRREFITLLGGAAAGWPLATGAQQAVQKRRIGVLMSFAKQDPESTIGTSAFEHGLEKRGWTLGRNLQIEYRWANTLAHYRRFARELVALNPDVILAVGGSSASALQEVTRTVPIVFLKISDPIFRRLIASMEQPGGNFTGLIEFKPSIGKKWLELLKQSAPNVTRVAVIQNPVVPAWKKLRNAIEKAAPSFSVEVSPVDVRNALAMERTITTFASRPNGGLIVTPSKFAVVVRQQIIALATRHKLPAIYFSPFFVNYGGLISYAPDTSDQYRRAADYVDRILKGEKPADMPVQAPTKYDLVISLKAAQMIDLAIPADVLAVADHVIK